MGTREAERLQQQQGAYCTGKLERHGEQTLQSLIHESDAGCYPKNNRRSLSVSGMCILKDHSRGGEVALSVVNTDTMPAWPGVAAMEREVDCFNKCLKSEMGKFGSAPIRDKKKKSRVKGNSLSSSWLAQVRYTVAFGWQPVIISSTKLHLKPLQYLLSNYLINRLWLGTAKLREHYFSDREFSVPCTIR